ncbi:MAG: LuxR C-terminal-related transcriptional regulator [Alphaproteobacteria bacterium]
METIVPRGVPPSMPDPALSRALSTMVGAIGLPEFSVHFQRALKDLADVDQTLVFSFEKGRGPSAIFGYHATEPLLVPRMLREYTRRFYTADPVFNRGYRNRDYAAPTLLKLGPDDYRCIGIRHVLYEGGGVVERACIAFWDGEQFYSTNLYRSAASGRFDAESLDRLVWLAPILASCITRHARLMDDPERAFVVREAFDKLSPREGEVVKLLLRGLPNRGIAAHMGVAEDTVLTLRKRAYAKLGVSSVGELYALVGRAVA